MKLSAMRLTGFLLLLSGWLITVAAIAVLKTQGQQAGFSLAGLGVEVLGLVNVVRSHFIPKGEDG